jgi:hypothetical protein
VTQEREQGGVDFGAAGRQVLTQVVSSVHRRPRPSLSSSAPKWRRTLQLAALVEDFDALLRLLELRVTEAGELDAAFVQAAATSREEDRPPRAS